MAGHPEITVIAAYETGTKISDALRDAKAAPALMVQNLTEAVTQAQKTTPENGIILLSPAAPSYDAFQNFEVRGEKFRMLFKAAD